MDIVNILRQARDAGFIVDVTDDDTLTVAGPMNRSDILSELRGHKAEIIAALRHPPAGVDHYTERLIQGVTWLETCWRRVNDEPYNERLEEAFIKNLHRWADLDEELRRVYPEFRGCPVGRCSETGPVRCLHCAEPALREGGA